MTEKELAQIIGRAQQRDPEAFDLLIDAYGRRLFGYLYRLTGSREQADDLLQELFLRVVQTIHGYEHLGRFEGWLFRIATNLVRDDLRKQKRAPRLARLDAGPEDAEGDRWTNRLPAANDGRPTPDPLVHTEEVDALQCAIARLPDAEREVVMLRHFAQLSFADIASMMGTPLGTALARGHRGLAKLKSWLTGSEEDAAT